MAGHRINSKVLPILIFKIFMALSPNGSLWSQWLLYLRGKLPARETFSQGKWACTPSCNTHSKAVELLAALALPNLRCDHLQSISLFSTLCPPLYKLKKGKKEDGGNGGGRESNVVHLLQSQEYAWPLIYKVSFNAPDKTMYARDGSILTLQIRKRSSENLSILAKVTQLAADPGLEQLSLAPKPMLYPLFIAWFLVLVHRIPC